MDNEAVIKLVAVTICVAILLAVGIYAAIVIVPLFVGSWTIDQFFKSKYNKKLEVHRAKASLTQEPLISLHAELSSEGFPLLAWDSNLLTGCSIEIYRMVGKAGVSLTDIRENGVLVLTSPKPSVETEEDVFEDYDAPVGTLYYVPVMTGNRTEERVCDYKSFSFNTVLRFVKKSHPFDQRGHSVNVRRQEIQVEVIEDQRTPIARLKDEILKDIKKRKADEAELDEAINLITQDDGLTENEKAIAIEKLESQFEPN